MIPVQPKAVALDFNGFFERSDLLNYRELFASEAADLKGKQLCQDLITMDKEEFARVQSESDQLHHCAFESRRYKILSIFALLAVTFVGICLNGHFSKRLSILHNGIRLNLGTGIDIIMILFLIVVGPRIVSSDSPALKNKIEKIHKARLIRLNEKCTSLERLYQNGNNMEDKEQVHFAWRHFSAALPTNLRLRHFR